MSTIAQRKNNVQHLTRFAQFPILLKSIDETVSPPLYFSLSRFNPNEQASGSCAAADLEAALQLLHLLFVAELRWDEGRLETVLSYVEENIRNQDKDPQERLMNLISHVNTQVRCVYDVSHLGQITIYIISIGQITI